MELTNTEISTAILQKEGAGLYNGWDNSGKPKSTYLNKVVQMTDEELLSECESKIWLSAYAANNPKSDYHWHCRACYDECNRRGKKEIYNKAYKNCTDNN